MGWRGRGWKETWNKFTVKTYSMNKRVLQWMYCLMLCCNVQWWAHPIGPAESTSLSMSRPLIITYTPLLRGPSTFFSEIDGSMDTNQTASDASRWWYCVWEIHSHALSFSTAIQLFRSELIKGDQEQLGEDTHTPGTLQSSKSSSQVLDPLMPSLSNFCAVEKPGMPCNTHTHTHRHRHTHK